VDLETISVTTMIESGRKN